MEKQEPQLNCSICGFKTTLVANDLATSNAVFSEVCNDEAMRRIGMGSNPILYGVTVVSLND